MKKFQISFYIALKLVILVRKMLNRNVNKNNAFNNYVNYVNRFLSIYSDLSLYKKYIQCTLLKFKPAIVIL